APGITAPEGSATCPRRRTEPDCANKGAAARTQITPKAHFRILAGQNFINVSSSQNLLRGISTGVAQVPAGEQRGGAASVGRGGKNRIHAAQQGDGRYFRTGGSLGGNNHHCIIFLQISQRDAGDAAQDLLKVRWTPGLRATAGSAARGRRSLCWGLSWTGSSTLPALRSAFQKLRQPLRHGRGKFAHLR